MVVQGDFSPDEETFFSWSADLAYKSGDNASVWMRKISRNIVTPAVILRLLALSSDPELRMAVADHLNTPLAVLILLAEDVNVDVRYALAENHNISRDVLNKLLNDSNPYVANRAERTLARLGAESCISDSLLAAA